MKLSNFVGWSLDTFFFSFVNFLSIELIFSFSYQIELLICQQIHSNVLPNYDEKLSATFWIIKKGHIGEKKKKKIIIMRVRVKRIKLLRTFRFLNHSFVKRKRINQVYSRNSSIRLRCHFMHSFIHRHQNGRTMFSCHLLSFLYAFRFLVSFQSENYRPILTVHVISFDEFIYYSKTCSVCIQIDA